MDMQSPAAIVSDPLLVPVDRLYRVSSDVYQSLIGHGLIEPEKVSLVDGLLVSEASGETLYRMPIDVYHGIAEYGLISQKEKVELLDGLLVKKMTIGPKHTSTSGRAHDLLLALPLGPWHVRLEQPVTLPTAGRDSEPEPDVAVVRGDRDDYDDRHPGPGEIALVVEVSESTLRDDRVGMARYAWANIPVAWIVSLKDRTVEVYTRPSGPADPAKYEEIKIYHQDDVLPVVIEGREVGRIVVKRILPRPSTGRP